MAKKEKKFYQHRDYLGRDIQIGDKVIFIQGGYRGVGNFKKGEVLHTTEKQVTIKIGESIYGKYHTTKANQPYDVTNSVPPERILIVNDPHGVIHVEKPKECSVKEHRDSILDILGDNDEKD